MREALTEAVADELAALDADRTAIAAKESILVVIEARVLDCQILTFGSNPGAVLVRHLGIVELDAVNRGVPSGDHPQPLALRILAVGENLRASSQQIVRLLDDHVVTSPT